MVYFGDTDSLINTGADRRKAAGEIVTHAIGDDLTVATDEAGTLYNVEVMSGAAALLELEELVFETDATNGSRFARLATRIQD